MYLSGGRQTSCARLPPIDCRVLTSPSGCVRPGRGLSPEERNSQARSVGKEKRNLTEFLFGSIRGGLADPRLRASNEGLLTPQLSQRE